MNLLIMVMTHQGVEETIKRHWPFWSANAQAHDGKVMFTCPVDSPISEAPGEILKIGNKGHFGPTSIKRFHEIHETMLRFPADWYMLCEYDSLCLSPQLPNVWHTPGFWATICIEPTAPIGFVAKYFFATPMMFSRDGLTQIVNAMDRLSPSAQGGFFDRWLGLLLLQEKIPWHGYQPPGYTENTIGKEAWGHSRALEAVKNGTVMVHGIKTPETLALLHNAYRERQP